MEIYQYMYMGKWVNIYRKLDGDLSLQLGGNVIKSKPKILKFRLQSLFSTVTFPLGGQRERIHVGGNVSVWLRSRDYVPGITFPALRSRRERNFTEIQYFIF